MRSLLPLNVRSGDRVDVMGYSERNRTTALLADVSIRKADRAALPPPLSVDPVDIFSRNVNGRRIRVRGEIVAHSKNRPGRMELNGDGFAFSAMAPENVHTAEYARWKPGSVVELIGVCQYLGEADEEEAHSSDSFRDYLNGAESVAIITEPSWWTEERSSSVAGGLALLVFAAVGWAAFPRGRGKQSRSQFLTAFHANPMPAWIVRERDFRCVEVNAEFERLFGRSRAELAGQAFEESGLWMSDGDCREFVKGLRENHSMRAVEARLQSRDGQTRNMLLSAEPISASGEPAILIIGYDVTEKLKLLAELRQAQKMEAVGQLAAGIAHDFNNLLTVICGNLGLIQMEAELDKDSLRLIGGAENAAARAADLTGQLLAFSRKSVMQSEALLLNSVVTEAAAILGRALDETIEVICQCADEGIIVTGDSGMLDQVLLNLGVNARDAMPNGGRLALSTRRALYDRESKPNHPDAVPGEFGVIEVADNGEGMSPETRDKAFEPFFTTKDVGKGTGLGLSTAYGILRQHGGWIDLESEPGVGTTFRIHLPVATASQGVSVSEVAREKPRRGAETILVIEDEAMVRDVVSETLTSYGYEVLQAEDGPTAEVVWADHAARVDLVLTDLVMPNGKSGFDIAREMRKQRADLKVVFMSGHSSELLDIGGSLVRGVDFLPKPFLPPDLVRLVRNRLDSN